MDHEIFIEAVRTGDLATVEKALTKPLPGSSSKKLDVNAPIDVDGKTALHLAAGAGNLDIVKLLVEHGATMTLDKCCTPLHRAAAHNQVAVGRYLLGHGIPVNTKARRGEIAGKDAAALHWCAEYGRLEFAEMLIHQGADIDAKNADGQTPLFVAAICSQYPLAKFLVSKGAAVDARDKADRTPLFEATGQKCQNAFSIAKLLLDAGADPRSQIALTGETPLSKASSCGFSEMVNLLNGQPVGGKKRKTGVQLPKADEAPKNVDHKATPKAPEKKDDNHLRTIRCEECGTRLQVQQFFSGRVRCTDCGHALLIQVHS